MIVGVFDAKQRSRPKSVETRILVDVEQKLGGTLQDFVRDFARVLLHALLACARHYAL